MTRLLDRADAVSAHADLAGCSVNFDPAELGTETWRRDEHHFRLGREAAGAPEPDGVWQTACRAVAAYEFSDPRLLRAVYDGAHPLVGRDMLLEGRWTVLRFYMGVRVTSVVDEERADGERAWGWGYETLEGHVERGRMSYEVVKHQGTGDVELVLRAVSQGAPSLGPLTTLGWKLFGRRTQLRFYRACGRRLAAFVAAHHGVPDPVPPRRRQAGLVLAPSDARPRWWDRFAVRRHQPS